MSMFNQTDFKTIEEYIAALEEPRRTEIQKIHDFIRKTVPTLEPLMVSGMPAYGHMHYKSKSGREGDWAKVLLSSRKNYISIYVCAVEADGEYIAEKHKEELKADVGKSCIRYKKFEDIPLDALAKVLKLSLDGTFGI